MIFVILVLLGSLVQFIQSSEVSGVRPSRYKVLCQLWKFVLILLPINSSTGLREHRGSGIALYVSAECCSKHFSQPIGWWVCEYICIISDHINMLSYNPQHIDQVKPKSEGEGGLQPPKPPPPPPPPQKKIHPCL